MPGSSLWLIPPPSHPLTPILTALITQTLPPRLDPSAPPFAPHITLTSNIPPSLYATSGPQAWLDALPFPPHGGRRDGKQDEGVTAGVGVSVRFDRVCTEDYVFRRCYIKICDGSSAGGLRELAQVARREGVLGGDEQKAREWVREEYRPHLSLVYSDEKVDEGKIAKVEACVRDAGVKLGAEEGEEREEGDRGQMGGWEGGVVWLVPTDRGIGEWKPIATRVL
ncbi:2, 3 cyclic phosphodiesterase [Pseudovirgaria hyperparasitica]|uniref:2, 3 cyclic phosphodiesterase n=1 Tax=Pseudovirgaria hyperparasitica TaxID=470096 RepID=A0A6A6WFJ0_9PEZI|nr:2, 3 cyclic phosphodiesterase [Pseudovirgaria hyperparasitica]KAF2761588.1 2, 3 cyclic phosphodiesterase [Pseudovirgaria hyperparasitica]